MITAMAPEKRPRYLAPALEKGLDVIELLAETHAPLTTQAIAGALGRSRSEIFRMVSVLEQRGYIVRGPDEGFDLTTRLLELAMLHLPVRGLLEVALPVMARLAHAARQSCHLAIASGPDMVVIARVESPDEVGFAVRIGHRRRLVDSTSGRVLLAFQEPEQQRQWLARIPGGARRVPRDLARDMTRIRHRGFRRANSSYVNGIVDLGVPIFDGKAGGAIAALTVPYVQKRTGPQSIAATVARLQAAAAEISAALAQRVGAAAAPARGGP